jgi:uncharacterized membrane protein YhfC
MNFILFSAVSALFLIILPIIVNGRFRKIWQMPKGIFVRAGLALLVIEVFYFTVASNMIAGWPVIVNAHPIVRALCTGLLAGLFYELGRYLVLDKIFKQVRSWREGIYFGFCWSALETVLLGIILVISVSGMQILVSSPDIASKIPEATSADAEQIKILQQEVVTMLGQSPVMALAPVFERVCLMIMDIALSLLMILGFYSGTTKFAWAAVGFRALFMASVMYAGGINVYAGEAMFLVYALLALLLMRQIRKSFPAK